MVYPRAMRAISDPLAMPITTACISRFQFTSIVRGLRASAFRERPADAETRALAHPCHQHHLSEKRLSDRLQINDLPVLDLVQTHSSGAGVARVGERPGGAEQTREVLGREHRIQNLRAVLLT